MALAQPKRLILILAAASAGIAVQLFVPCPQGIWGALFDAGHVVVYGLVALAILVVLRAFAVRSARPARRPYLPALTATIGLELWVPGTIDPA